MITLGLHFLRSKTIVIFIEMHSIIVCLILCFAVVPLNIAFLPSRLRCSFLLNSFLLVHNRRLNTIIRENTTVSTSYLIQSAFIFPKNLWWIVAKEMFSYSLSAALLLNAYSLVLSLSFLRCWSIESLLHWIQNEFRLNKQLWTLNY